MRRLSLGKIAALCIAFFTLAVGLVVNRVVFERLPHLEDEFAYLYQSKLFARGQFWVESHDNPKYFWQPFILQQTSPTDGIEKRFGKYTPGWPLLLSIGSLLGTPWLVNAVLGMLNVLFVYRLGREIFNEAVGLVAALLLAICPIAITLNASLMSHVSVMFMGIVFTYGYWRIVKNDRRRYLWAALAGLSLGLMVTTRPLSAVAIAAPIILHSASRLFDALTSHKKRHLLLPILKPLLLLSICVAPTAALWPLGNYIWTGDWHTNTYTLLWGYDKPGFGEGFGRNKGGHSPEYALRNARNDMKVYLRDLYGFTMAPELEQYLSSNLGWGAGVGLSWILVIVGLIAGRKNEWVWLFFLMLFAIIIAQMFYWIGSVVNGGAAYSIRYWYEATFAVCLVSAYGIVKRNKWIWYCFLGFVVVIVIDWIISTRNGGAAYSIRYWYETIFLICILAVYVLTMFFNSFQPKPSSKENDSTVIVSYLNGIHRSIPPTIAPRVTTFAQRLRLAWGLLWPGYILFFIACLVSLIGYTPARLREPLPPDWEMGLYRYNKVGEQQLDALKAAREKYGQPNQPVLIIVLSNPDKSKKDDWRNYGAYMANTSPFLDSDIVLARIFEAENVPEMIERFPGRLVLYQIDENLYNSIEAAEAGASQLAQTKTANKS